MSTALIIGGVVLGVAVLAGVTMMGKKRDPAEDTGFGVEDPQYPNEENQSGGRRSRTRSRTHSRRSRSRHSKRVKI